jgi:hypothetical protein
MYREPEKISVWERIMITVALALCVIGTFTVLMWVGNKMVDFTDDSTISTDDDEFTMTPYACPTIIDNNDYIRFMPRLENPIQKCQAHQERRLAHPRCVVYPIANVDGSIASVEFYGYEEGEPRTCDQAREEKLQEDQKELEEYCAYRLNANSAMEREEFNQCRPFIKPTK